MKEAQRIRLCVDHAVVLTRLLADLPSHEAVREPENVKWPDIYLSAVIVLSLPRAFRVQVEAGPVPRMHSCHTVGYL